MTRFKRYLALSLIAVAVMLGAARINAQWQLPTGSVTTSVNPDNVSLVPTALSESGDIVTVTVTNSLAPGQSFTISGATPSGYNGNYYALTASSSSITALSLQTSLGAGTVFGTLQTPAIGPGGLVTNTTGLVAQVAPGPIYCGGVENRLNKTNFTLNASTTYYVFYRCPTNQVIATTSYPLGTDILLATVVAGTSSLTITDNRQGYSQAFPPSEDFVWAVPLHDCAWNLTTGALATASTIGENVGIVFAATNNPVNQLKTTAATSVANLDCDISVPFVRTQGTRGYTVNQIEVRYGYQTTALSAIATPTLATVTMATSGNSTAAGLVASVGGTLIQNVGTSHGTPGSVTTTGTCFNETTIPTTPILITNALQRLTLEQIFSGTTSDATIYQLCGVVVYGSYIQ